MDRVRRLWTTPGASMGWSLLLGTVLLTGCGGSDTPERKNPPTGPERTAPLTLASEEMPDGTVGEAYGHDLAATGGTPPYTWELGAGGLPEGLTLDGASIEGEPTVEGDFDFSVRVRDQRGDTATATFTLRINAPPSAPAITTGSLPGAVRGEAYSVSMAAEGGAPPYRWSLASGSLPDGLGLSSDGELRGAATEDGTFDFTVEVTDANELSARTDLTLDVAQERPPLALETSEVPVGQVDEPYDFTFEARGGAQPYTWGLTAGPLPAGLTLFSEGRLRGTPTEAVSRRIGVVVRDASGAEAEGEFSLVIRSAAPPPSITTTSAPKGFVGRDYRLELGVSGGTPPLTWSVASGALPGGLVLDGPAISGIPTEARVAEVSVRVRDEEGRADTLALSLEIVTTPSITTTSLPTAVAGEPYSAVLDVEGGEAPYQWDLQSGSLPGGLTLSTDGRIAGTPTEATTGVSFVARVRDGNGEVDTRELTLDVSAPENRPPVPVIAGADCVQEGDGVACHFSSEGSTDPDGEIVDWRWTFGDGSSGSGAAPHHTYTVDGTYGVTLVVTDDDGASGESSPFQVTIEIRNQAPSASFSIACAFLTCTMIQESSDPDGEIVAYAWDFGDGTTLSGVAEPTHEYGEAGVYEIRLTVTDDADARATALRTARVNRGQIPRAGYTHACDDLTCTFTDTSSDDDGEVVGWSWDFGDGQLSTTRDPVHTYAEAGRYSVRLVVTDDQGNVDDFTRPVDAGMPEAPGFQIDLYFDETVPPELVAPMRAAADRFERIIRSELEASYDWSERTVGDRCDRPAIPFIDDMAIVVTVRSLSGSTLARAGPCFVRGSGASAGFPIYGSVEIDDGATGWPYDKAVEILSHEIGHVVGIGTLWDPLILDPCGRDGGRAHFGGGNAVREYDAAGGSPPDSLYVQDGSEAQSGLCFPGDHWGYLMESEIMSPSTPVAGAIQPLSAITIGALDDLGWIVDYAEADPFTPRAQGAPLRAPGGDERGDIVARDWRIRD